MSPEYSNFQAKPTQLFIYHVLACLWFLIYYILSPLKYLSDPPQDFI